MVTLISLPVGSFFKRKADSKKVWIRGNYERSSKKFSCIDFDDSCHEMFLKGSTLVVVDFDF